MSELTIVIPTLNRLELLKRALGSALAQTAEVEIVVSDNGCTDGTQLYLGALRLPPNVRLFRHDVTMPVQDHAAFQFDQVATPWAVFLSDDDYLEPEFAERVLALIAQRPNLKLVYTGCDLIYGDIRVPAKVGPQVEDAADFFLGFMEGGRNICLCATAFHMDELRAVGRQPPTCVIGDMFYWTRILSTGGLVGCVDRRLSHYTFFWPRRSSETNRTPVDTWAKESVGLADRMLAVIRRVHPNLNRTASRARERFLATTIANQMTWNALAGWSRVSLAKSLATWGRLLAKDITAVFQSTASVMLPRPVLNLLMLAYARRLAFKRRRVSE